MWNLLCRIARPLLVKSCIVKSRPDTTVTGGNSPRPVSERDVARNTCRAARCNFIHVMML